MKKVRVLKSIPSSPLSSTSRYSSSSSNPKFCHKYPQIFFVQPVEFLPQSERRLSLTPFLRLNLTYNQSFGEQECKDQQYLRNKVTFCTSVEMVTKAQKFACTWA
jgi:hypothetical protein